MKIRRYKKAFKNLQFYVNNFRFRIPYQVLIDGTFCFTALQNGIQIKEALPSYFRSEVHEIKFLTTPCVVLETEKLGHQVTGAMKIVKTFGTHSCGHNKNPLPGSDCLLSMVGSQNQNRYIIATQDKDLQKKLQAIPSVPVLYINRTSIILKSHSAVTISRAKEKKQAVVELTEHQEKVLNALKKNTVNQHEPKVEPEVRKPKGPNPLSCKKKKRTAVEDGKNNSEINSHKRKRKRLRIPKHVKEELYLMNVPTLQETQMPDSVS